MTMQFDPYSTGVLQKEHHERLVADLDNFARDAGIQPHWIWTSLPDDFGKDEREYMRNFRKHQSTPGASSGVCYSGKNMAGEIEQRMSAFAGCLVRNFIRARVMTLGTVLDSIASDGMPDITCLLIPNFFLSSAEGGTIAKWQVSALLDYLTLRYVHGLQTILYASDMALLGKEYGLSFTRLIDGHYLKISI